jgi:hypothetical protein
MRQGTVSVPVSPKIGLVPPVTRPFSVLTASVLRPTEVRQLGAFVRNDLAVVRQRLRRDQGHVSPELCEVAQRHVDRFHQ